MTGQAAPAAAANTGVSEVPVLDHPSTIPLHLEGDTVKDAAGNTVLEQLSGLASLNMRESKHGALVFGAASQHGPACCWDLTAGKVRAQQRLQQLCGCMEIQVKSSHAVCAMRNRLM
jgi:hypothetical protein